MGDVTPFPVNDTELGYWRCDCGGLTFYARTDRQLECAACGDLVRDASGAWRIPPSREPEDKRQEESYSHVLKWDDPKTALRHFAREAAREHDIEVAIVITQSGRCRTWGNTDDLDWLDRMFKDARFQISGKVS